MVLRDHPRVQWPPSWIEYGSVAPSGEQGILKDVDRIAPTQILLGNEFHGKVYFAQLSCSNRVFADRLVEKISSLVGRPIQDVGALEIDA